ncbi:hypothetical protein KDP63_002042 [Salmonella enterica]|nr:hypothetical protein [Salmonella enterica]EDP9431872.1 hypothetical protein [Salmonella enterica subsp. diarizonae]EDT8253721.1 hypothetical protein [Salmonella enterica subsp. diarizonae serovar 48:z52:z]EKN5803116.1 hypothetical protein [Salmonella enterica subsp. enterica]EDR1735362.1 hypothetical protein [Salmonella enterica subsp. diarizonae]EDT3565328.1 hypothetical protein [Salmonella enterica subsp. diarizonae]
MVAELDSHLAADVGSVHIDEEAGGDVAIDNLGGAALGGISASGMP